MSENSLENSTLSETNSDEASKSVSSPSITESPPSAKQHQNTDDEVSLSTNNEPEIDTQLTQSAATEGTAINERMVYLNIQDNLTSLPVNLMQQQQPITAVVNDQLKPVFDTELADLLTRRKTVIQTVAPKCAKCNKSVYKAEEVRAANKMFHKLCFKCTSCNKLLETNILSEHLGDLYCRNCYGKNFGPKGYGYGVGAGIMTSSDPASVINNGQISPVSCNASDASKPLKPTYSTLPSEIGSESTVNAVIYSTTRTTPTSNANRINSPASGEAKKPVVFGGADKCARCVKSVYAAEKVTAANKSYHKLCFTCATCKKMLNSMNCCDNSDNQVFCKACYGKQYGPKGIGFGIGAGTLQTN